MKERESVLQRISRKIASVNLSEMIVLYADRRVTVRGCRRILIYSPREIAFSMRERAVRIMGENLRCVSFSEGCATVEGKIASVTFSDEEELQ